MVAPEIAELLGSVSVPVIVAFVCACVGEGWKSAKPKRIAARKVQSLIVPPLPLARELKVVPVRAASARTWIETPPVSWLGGETRLPGPIRLRHVIRDEPDYRRPSHPVAAGQWLAPKNSALQSRGGDGFSPS